MSEQDSVIKFRCVYTKSHPFSEKEIAALKALRQRLYGKKLINVDRYEISHGNASMRIGAHAFLITGSGTSKLKKVTGKHFCRVTKADITNNTVYCEGPMRASSESMTHSAVYQAFPEVNVVIHAHHKKAWQRWVGKVPTTAKNALYGTPEIAKETIRLLKNPSVRKGKFLILGGHKPGILAFGKTMQEAEETMFKYTREDDEQTTIKAVLFDLDDTLYEFNKVKMTGERAAYDIFRKYFPSSFSAFHKKYLAARAYLHAELGDTASSHNRLLYFQHMVEAELGKPNPRLVLTLEGAYWNIILNQIKPRAGTIEAFKALKKKGIKIGIVSDLMLAIQMKKIRKLGLSTYIDAIVTSEEAGQDKPNKRIFMIALKKFGLSAKQALFIGDSPSRDISGAKNIGMKTALLKRKEVSVPTTGSGKPDYVVREMNELLEIVGALGQ